VGIGFATLGTMEIFDPAAATAGLYRGMPAKLLLPPHSPGSQLALHLIGVLGAVHLALAATLVLSVAMEPAARQSVSIGTGVALVLHIGALFRTPAFLGMKITPSSMPMLPLLICVTTIICAILSEQNVDQNIARSAILTAERKEFKGKTMENRAYDKRCKEAMAEKGLTNGMFGSSKAD
jgi:hypothetical protein